MAVRDVPGPLGAPADRAGVLGDVPAALSRGRLQWALEDEHQRLAELLRLALRVVEDREMSTVTRRAFLASSAALLAAPLSLEAREKGKAV